MELRGFDTYVMTLGDEMRGERASMNKSLSDVERDLRIKGTMIEAIEDCDLAAFPNQSVIAGYVRCYARYLGMDVDDCYRRFCEESGFRSPVAMIGGTSLQAAGSDPLNSAVGAQLGKSRFAAPPMPRRFSAPVSLGGLISSLALVTILGGVSYGGYAFLQDIQRVGFAPLVEAPDIVAEVPSINAPQADAELARPDAEAYAEDGPLAGLSIQLDPPLPSYPRRDGPISAIDPQTYGVFARPEVEVPTREGVASGVVDSADDAILAGTLQAEDVGIGVRDTGAEPNGPTQVAKVDNGISVYATEEAWVRIRESQNTILFEAVMGAGDRFDLPELAEEPVLRAGNAGGVFVRVDGIVYGPVGGRGKVVKNLSLSADAIREQFPKVEDSALLLRPAPSIVQSASVALD